MTALTCMATAIFFEARGEPLEGQHAVADVILNRVEDTRYPDDVCSVVFEPYAFSFTHDGRSDRLPETAAADVAMAVAEDALSGQRLGLTATHYHTTAVQPYWAEHFEFDGRIGNHLFYTNETPHK